MTPSPPSSAAAPKHFRDRAAYRRWLERNHTRAAELWIGFYRKGTNKAGMTYAEAVDESLCWGWIDGIKKRVDDERYTNRFTSRKPKSRWSTANLSRYAELDALGQVAEPGRAAYRRFDPATGSSSADERPERLAPPYEASFRAHAAAWTFFTEQPPGYRRTAVGWVMSAKREPTRRRRLAQLIEFSGERQRIPQLAGRPARPRP